MSATQPPSTQPPGTQTTPMVVSEPQQLKIFEMFTIATDTSQMTVGELANQKIVFTFTPVTTTPPPTFQSGGVTFSNGAAAGQKTLKSISLFISNHYGGDNLCVATTTSNVLTVRIYNMFAVLGSVGIFKPGAKSCVMSYSFLFTDNTVACTAFVMDPGAGSGPQQGGSDGLGKKTINNTSELHEYMKNLHSHLEKKAHIPQSGGGRRRFKRKSRKHFR
jgi:hypothetical protein